MTTAEAILAAFASRLAAAGTGATVERSRTVAFDRDALPAIVIRPKSEESTPLGALMLRCTLHVEVEINTRGDQPDQLADPIAAVIDAAIRADSTLGGLALRAFRSGKDWEFSDSDGTGGKLTISYQIHYAEPA